LRAWLAFALPLILAACGGASTDDPPPFAGVLFDADKWVELDASQDPFVDRPQNAECAPGGFGAESGVLEVQTEFCPYLTVSQPLGVDLAKGTKIESILWHLELFSGEPTEGHIALKFADQIVEAHPRIPGPEAFYTVDWTLPEDVPAGTLAHFHVHNHGFNSWRLGPVEAKPMN
jgi:hypothetical protein